MNYPGWESRLGKGVPMLFEENPAVLLVIIVVVVEMWLRVREPLFHLVARPFRKDRPS